MAKQVISHRYWDNALNRFVSVVKTVKPRGKRTPKVSCPSFVSLGEKLDLHEATEDFIARHSMSLRASGRSH